MQGFNIGNVKVDVPIVLAPLDGVNCTAFRLLCKEYGAGLIYTAMVDADRFVKEEDPIKRLINPQEEERPLVVQIVGANKENLAKAVKEISKVADVIDYNLGCCEGDILGKKAGCYLMKHNDQLDKIIPVIIKNSSVPVTCKLRSGWDIPKALKVAKQLEHHGVAAISVHPRLKIQGYHGKADWNLIKELKNALKIPVIGNGDITRASHALAMMSQTKCDAVMIGRAAKGNPMIFKAILHAMKTGNILPEPTRRDRKQAFLRFLELYKEKEARYKFTELRDHAGWFAKGDNQLKEKIRKTENDKQLIDAW